MLADLATEIAVTGDIVRLVNATVNQVPYVVDVTDNWQTPVAFFARGGDCEDYAIAKMLLLEAIGVPVASMWIAVLRDPGHAVLIIETPDGPRVLDNMAEAPYAPDQRLAARVVYAFNFESMWVAL